MHRKICHIIFIVIMLSVFQSCKEETKYRIGVSQCSNDDWRTKMNEEIQREIMFHPEATVEIRSANDTMKSRLPTYAILPITVSISSSPLQMRPMP